jgi:hypothetical protein
MSADIAFAFDECASIMACPALGLMASLEPARSSAKTVRGWSPRYPVGTTAPPYKQFFPISPCARPTPGQTIRPTKKGNGK